MENLYIVKYHDQDTGYEEIEHGSLQFAKDHYDTLNGQDGVSDLRIQEYDTTTKQYTTVYPVQQKSVRQIIWTLPDEDADKLIAIAQKHTKLALEAFDRMTTDSRKAEIDRQISELRASRDEIIRQYKN
jgi:hypothetical protein